jgi:outer membrane protein OmpA-like peptidoglycan-associated protein
MKRTVVNVLVVAHALVLFQGCASTKQRLDFEPGSIDTDRYVRKVDQFVIIADGSLSMSDRSRGFRKFEISQALLASLNQTIPDFDYRAGLRTFGRGLCGSKGKTVSIVDVGEYIDGTYGDGIGRYECSNGYSPLDKALPAAAGDLSDIDAPTAIVVVTDGLNMGTKAIKAAAALKQTFGDDLDLYAVQIGNDRHATRFLEKAVSSAGEGYVVAAHDLTAADAMSAFVVDVLLWPDDDGDGVANHLDECPDTPKGVTVDAVGCPIDSDGDGVPDYLDKCPDTPAGVKVDADGCPLDSDGDGVPDHLDRCPDTPAGVKVDATGCPLDSDGDGVPDHRDKCPGTPRGTPVDRNGCPIAGIEVAGDEWFVRGRVLFDLNRANIKPDAAQVLSRIAAFLIDNPQYQVEIQGNTDGTGPMAWNMKLSEMRAEAVREYLVGKGVAAGRLTTRGFGPHEPIAPNNTAEGRARNRRVDFKPTAR